MNKWINSPIVITVIVLTALFTMKSQMHQDLGSQIRGAYDELIEIAEDAGSDAEKTQVIQDFASQIATQLKDGFSAGFSSGSDKESSEAKFLRVRKLVEIVDLHETQADWKGRQAILFTLKNQSEYPLAQLRLNLEYYRGDKLIDVKNESLHEIKVLDAGESIPIKKDRSIPNHLTDEEKAAYTFDSVKATVTSFRIED